jgi:hypothetical protein
VAASTAVRAAVRPTAPQAQHGNHMARSGLLQWCVAVVFTVLAVLLAAVTVLLVVLLLQPRFKSGTDSTSSLIPLSSSSLTHHRYRLDALSATAIRFPPFHCSSLRATIGEEKIRGGRENTEKCTALCPMPVLRCVLCKPLGREQWPVCV